MTSTHRVHAALREKFEAIAQSTGAYCDQHLNDEWAGRENAMQLVASHAICTGARGRFDEKTPAPLITAGSWGAAVAQWGSDPNSGHGLRADHGGDTDLGSDPDWAGRENAMQLVAAHAGSTGARGRFDEKLPARPTTAGSRGAAVAQWGSDPNSGHGLRADHGCDTDLGSDPDWAGRESAIQLIAAHAGSTVAGGRFDIKTGHQQPLNPARAGLGEKEAA